LRGQGKAEVIEGGSMDVRLSYTGAFVGEGILFLNSLKAWVKRGHIVSAVCSTDEALLQWTQENNIPAYQDLSSFHSFLSRHKPDYLWSVVNSRFLSPALLRLPKYLAINYHDSLLPRYAGVNATSWAILNSETEHGVSWHVMDENIDGGDILIQAHMTIEPAETAQSLNVKCFELAEKSFKTLVRQFEKKQYQRKPQDFSKRTYHGYKEGLPQQGLLNWNQPAVDIDRLFRASYLGESPNHFGRLYFFNRGRIYVIEALKCLSRLSQKTPGILVSANKSELIVSTKTHLVQITHLLDEHGQSVDLAIFKDQVGKSLESVGKKRRENSESSHLPFSVESKLISLYQTIEPFELIKKMPLGEPPVFNDRQDLRFPSLLKKRLRKCYPVFSFEEILLTVWLVYLCQLQPNNMVTVAYESADATDSLLLPLTLQLKEKEGFAVVLKKLKKQIEFLNEIKSGDKTLFSRYPSLRRNGQLFLSAAQSAQVKIKNSLQVESKISALTLLIDKKKGKFCLMYPSEQCSAYWAKTTPQRLTQLLMRLSEKKSSRVNELTLLSDKEVELFKKWNNTRTSFPKNKTLHELFKAQVLKNPHKKAICWEGEEISYAELDTQSDQVRHRFFYGHAGHFESRSCLFAGGHGRSCRAC